MPRPTVVVVGSADKFDKTYANRVERLFKEALAPICSDAGAAVVYGGTNSGIMSVLGRVMAEFAPDVPLIGVAPDALVSFNDAAAPPRGAQADANHTHFLTSPGDEWGTEGEVLVGMTERLAKGRSIVVVVVGGGSGTRYEVSLACQRGWPVLIVGGVPGTGAELADLAKLTDKRLRAVPVAHDIKRSISDRALTVRDLGDVDGCRRALRWRLSGDVLLKEAWLRLGTVDRAASRAKPRVQRLKLVVLALGVLSTLLAIVVGKLPSEYRDDGRVALVVIPAIAGGVVAFIARRRRDDRWISIRAAAQAVAREIYRFRTHAGAYWVAHERGEDRLLLATALAAVDARLSGETALGVRPQGFSIWPPQFIETAIDPRDELLRSLDGSTYDDIRVEDQIRYFSRMVERGNATTDRILVAVYAASVAATFIGALAFQREGFEVWVALAVAVGAALVSWLDAEQLEQQSVQMALAAAGVRAARERWLAEAAEDVRNKPRSVAVFADEVEEVLEAEAAHWERTLRQAHRSFRAYAGAAA